MSNFLDETRGDAEIAYSQLTKSKRSSNNVLQLATIGDKVPPHSTEAEMAVLGSIMLDKAALSKSVEVLIPDSFYQEKNKKIFELMLWMSERNITIDIVSLGVELRNHNLLEAIGGSFYLAQINQNTPTAANIDQYARIVQEHALKRQLIDASSNILARCYDLSTDALDEIDKAESEIFCIAEQRLRKSYISMKDLAKGTFATIASMVNGENKENLGISTGFVKLDDMIGGLRKSDLLIIAARPSMGKTALALSIARNIAMDSNVGVAFFSIEMAAEQLSMRLLSAEARINVQKIMRGDIDQNELGPLAQKMDRLAKTPIFIDDSASLSVMELRAKCRRLKAEQNIGVVMIDYLQLMNAPTAKNESREREISTISRSLKQIAKELNIPVIALSQLNRGVEARSDKRPMLSDLRESGSIEQDADLVMFVHRPEHYELLNYDDGQTTAGTAELIIGKQRNGPVGTVRVAYLKEYARFENLTFGADTAPDFASSISNFNASLAAPTDEVPF